MVIAGVTFSHHCDKAADIKKTGREISLPAFVAFTVLRDYFRSL